METSKYKNGTTSQIVKTGAGTLYGIIINSHTTGTIKLWDNTAGSGTVLMNTFTPATGSSVHIFPMGISFYTGLYITKAETIDYTLLYF